MAARIPGRAVPETGQGGAYCAFKDDRARLFALISRDLRLVAIAVIIAFVIPAAPGVLARALSVLMRAF